MPNRFGDDEATPAGVNRFGDSATGPAQPDHPSYWHELWRQSGIPGLIEGLRSHPVDTIASALGQMMPVGGFDPVPTAGGVSVSPPSQLQNAQEIADRGPAAIGAAATLGALPIAAVAAPKIPISDAMASLGDRAATSLRESANTQYGRVLNATTKGNKLRSERVAPELAERGVVAGTLKGLQQKVTGALQRTGQELNDAYEGLPANASVPLDDVMNRLDFKANQEFTVPTKGGPVSPSSYHDSGLALVNDIKNRLTAASEMDPETGFRSIPVDRVRQMRQMYDEVANLAGRYDGKALADHSQAAVQGMAADSLRQVLADNQPSIAALNKEYSFWKDADRVIGDTLTRRQGQAVPLGVKIAKGAGTGAGYVTGGIQGAIIGREAMGLLERAMSSTGWRTASAVMKTRLARALSEGDRAGADAAIRSLATATGAGATASTTPATASQ